ncbi:hypothetical protein COEREDRAFT_88773 [Coemansia reversa NRRL 1564]|uniref:Hexosyltransferase n=1 Tax=Coemansia reversa (strain ATCC 12441 / NRRL 1564) TaxID=763665 RepID=A0A2G5B5V9_COERN|nr:hypothetical protein COEREDRAFT_88773 [Coemansia reversa NRRL 1564]|eukprot:PIA14384.1 hypothetical protein COEREDRAFT_88773 [Coemansia reversa NRRL 1564]
MQPVSTTTTDLLESTPISTHYKLPDLNLQPTISIPSDSFMSYTTYTALPTEVISKSFDAPTQPIRPTRPVRPPTKPKNSILSELPTLKQMQGVVPLVSQFKGSPIRKLSKPRKLNILFYTMIGLTFDEKACGFFSGCSKTYKVCDQNIKSTSCDITLKKKYSYTSLANKKKELIETMCKRYNEYSKYDLFIKVDDDLMFKPEEIEKWAESIEMPSKTFIGYFKMSKDKKAIWPTGAIYMYTKDILADLCQNKNVLSHMNGTFEDVQFSHAIQLTGNVTYYNLDHQINVYHTRYKSDRVYIRYLRGKGK